MNHVIKIRKRRFAAAVLSLLLLLNQLPPFSAHAADAYGVDALYEGQTVSPGDTISNSSDTSCMVIYYDHGETGGELSSGTIAQDAAHTVPAYTGTVPAGCIFTGWKVLTVVTGTGGVVESITLEAMVVIDGKEIVESLTGTTLEAGTVIYNETNLYTIMYYDQNGETILIDAAQINANTAYTVAGYPGTVPTGHRFTGWTVHSVWASGGSGAIELTAQLPINQYTIAFDTDGGSSVPAITADYGAAVAAPENPTKTGYTFAGWNPEIPTAMPAENITITAQWTANKYTIQFVNEDGSELQRSEVAYDELPVYSGETPTKAATAEHSYTFAGWSPEITAVTGDATYTATFAESANQYTIAFVNEDGTELQSSAVAYGEIPVYNGETPAKAATAEHSYTFAGWSPEITAVTGDATYTATFTESANQYTIAFVNEDGTVLQSGAVAYGEIPVYSGETPTKAATAEHSYTFAGWSPEITAVAGDATYTATFTESVNQYTVAFVNEDGTVLQSSAVAYGEIPVYSGETPTKAATAEHSYTFAGWSPEITAVAGDATYTATFTESVNQYTVAFVNEDGTVLQSGAVAYGENPVYSGETPTKAATAEHSYTFAGWSSEVTAVTGDATYTATFTESVNQYTVAFVNENGTVLQSSAVAYGEIPIYNGEAPAKAATAEHSYTFAGWTPEIVEVTGEATYTAVYTRTVNKYTVQFVDEDGTQLQSGEVAYGEMPAYTGEIPTKAATTEHSYTFAGWTPEITEVTGEATYTAVYTRTANRYTITFDTAGGSEIASITQDYGTAVTAPANPTRTGYTFAGWDQTIPATMPAENITITARWTANRYSIRYVLNGGTNGDNPSSYTYGSGVSGFADASKLGNSFAGWYESADFSGNKVTAVAADRTGELVLYAKFEMITIAAGTYSLTAGVAYKLGNVTKVSGDNSIYTPGSTFYVPVSGYYTFS